MTANADRTLTAVYRVRESAAAIAARAKTIALEQSIEMPDEIVSDAFVRDGIVGRVEDIQDRGKGEFDVRIALVKNPSTPTDLALALVRVVPRPHLEELASLADVPVSVRDAARRLCVRALLH